MVNIIKYIIFFLLMLSQYVNGQDLTLGQLQDLIILSENAKVFQSSNVARSNVYIEQIGDNNDINSNVSAQETTIVHQQKGNNNHINIDVGVKELEQSIFQNGNSNHVVERVYNTNAINQFYVEQNGNNLVLEKYGTNSLSDKIKVSMKGKGTTIIIRNFK